MISNLVIDLWSGITANIPKTRPVFPGLYCTF